MNKRGFTLIELLAAIVLLGLLMSLAITTMVRTIEKGRKKTYISDANSMVAQVEYLVKSQPDKIERPAMGNCVVIFLSYFYSDDFSTPPNGGTYDQEKSFVVYKNIDNSKYEFSATIIEELKGGGYQGVKLTKGIDLSKGNGMENTDVSGINFSSYSTSNVGSYINNTWSGYCTSVDSYS